MRKVLFLAVLLTACNPLRHYQKVATDINVTTDKKQVIAPWVAVNFPVEVKYIKGDSIIKIDSNYNKDRIDSMAVILDSALKGCNVNIDSIKKAWLKLCVPKVITKTVVRIDTLVKLDTAPLTYVTNQYNQEVAKNTVLQATIGSKDKKIAELEAANTKLIVALVIACLTILALLYLLFKPKISLP